MSDTPETPVVAEGVDTPTVDEVTPETIVDEQAPVIEAAAETPVVKEKTPEELKQERQVKQAEIARKAKQRQIQLERDEERRLANEFKALQELKSNPAELLGKLGVSMDDLIVDTLKKNNLPLPEKKEPDANERIAALEKRLEEALSTTKQATEAELKRQQETQTQQAIAYVQDYLSAETRKDLFPAIAETKSYDKVFTAGMKYISDHKLSGLSPEDIDEILEVTADVVEENLLKDIKLRHEVDAKVLARLNKTPVVEEKKPEVKKELLKKAVEPRGLPGRRETPKVPPALGEGSLRSGGVAKAANGWIVDKELRLREFQKKHGLL